MQALRPLFDNVWGVPLYTSSSTWGNSQLMRPEMNIREKIHHIIRVCEIGARCREVQVGDLVILPEDNGGAVVTVRREDGKLERRYCFSEHQALAVWQGEVPGVEDTTLSLPQTR